MIDDVQGAPAEDTDMVPLAAGDRHEERRARGPMRVLGRTVYRGPHVRSLTPMIAIRLDLGELEEWPSNRLSGFADALLSRLPGLHRHGCSLRRPGGFVQRLRDGTWLGHVAEHVALELQVMTGPPVRRGKTRSVQGARGTYDVLYAYRDEEVGLLAGRTAIELIDSLLPEAMRGVEGLERIAGGEAPFEFDEALARLEALQRRRRLGPTTQSLVDEATRRGIPTLRLDDRSLIQLGTGSLRRLIRASVTDATSLIGSETAKDKDLAKAALAEAGVPVPQGAVVRSAAEAVRAARRIGFPVVAKPLDGNHGRGVCLGLRDEEQVTRGFDAAARHGRRVIIERQFEGNDHRILVVGGKVEAVAERVPAHVIGDGRRTVAELVAELNRDPRRGEGHEKPMTRIRLEGRALEVLGRAGLGPDSVPPGGWRVALSDAANLSTGGTAIDRTGEIHPENALIAERAARIVGLDVAGVDFICPDIGRSVLETGGGVVEVNAAPGLRMHLEPSQGRPRNVARAVIDMLFPEGAPSRIPILAVTGTNGKSTTARMVDHILRADGRRVGLTSTSGIFIDGRRATGADASGPRSARMVLRDPTVDVAVLETARGGILREGLGFRACDVGLVTNIQADHLGLKGVETLSDLARVKSVVVRAVRRDGVSVLNADDPLTFRMRRCAGGRLAWFSMRGGDAMPGFLRQHVETGGLAVVRAPDEAGEEAIFIHQGGSAQRLMRTADIPATLGGQALFNVQNALGAVAMAHAVGVAPGVIRLALSGFASTYEQNPGRLNIHDRHGFTVIVDYAHNPNGLAALGDLLARLRPRHGRIIGMANSPGDRRDEDMRLMGALAARHYDDIVFREDPVRRGRRPSEIIGLLTEGALAAGCAAERIFHVPDEMDAVDACLRRARPGDLVVLTATDVAAVWARVNGFRPESARQGASPADVRMEQRRRA